MKPRLSTAVSILALISSPFSYAQNSVQVYGLLDTAVEYVTNVNAAGNNLIRMPNLSGGIAPSRIGFRGAEDLGGGLMAIFTLENGFAPDTGALNNGNRLFGRQAWVGLSGQWGAISVGRNYTMLFHSFIDVDVIGPSQFSFGAMDTYIPNARSDNSIAYKGTFSGMTVGATYSVGHDTSNAGGPAATNCGGEFAADKKACREWSAMVRYDTSTWGLVGAYDSYNGGPGAFAPFSPQRSDLSDSRAHIGGYYKIGNAKIAGGLLRRNNEGNASRPKSNLAYIGGSYQFGTSWMIDAQFARFDPKGTEDQSDLFAIRATNNLSKRTAVYLMYGHMGNDGRAAVPLSVGGTATAGVSQNGLLAGIKHSF